MATPQRTVDHLFEQALASVGCRPNRYFGEYAVYVDGKMIGSIGDDRLFVKPTASGRPRADPVSEAPPYPGAKPHLLIKADRWDDAEWLGALLRVTVAELPISKSRKPKPSA